MKHYIDLANLEINQGPSWLRKLKISSLETFTKLGFPNRKNESWRFTNIDKFVQNNLTPIIDSTKKLTINETKITSHLRRLFFDRIRLLQKRAIGRGEFSR